MVEAPVRPTQTTDGSAGGSADDSAGAGAADLAEGRGTLDVRNKALQHIIERVVLQVPGTVTRHSALGRITGMALPKADITTEGRSAVVKVDVAMAWPGNMSQVATAARDTVRREAFRLSGIQIRSVDVTVHAVDPATAEDTRRVE